MRKLLGLLAAAVFVTASAGSALAINLTTATVGTTNLAVFSAEHAFFQTGSASFGFSLHRMTGQKPTSFATENTAQKIDWEDVSDIVAGVNAFKASKVYAKVVNKAYTAATFVRIYTDNTNVNLTTTQYKYTIDSSTIPYGDGSAQTINALVEKSGSTKANTSSGNFTLPLSYKILIASTTDTGNYNVATDAIPAGAGEVFYVTDKAKTAKPQNGEDLASDAYSSSYATISSPEGMRTWDIGFSNADVENWYMFFASNFAKARNGYSYGTDSLTIELDVE